MTALHSRWAFAAALICGMTACSGSSTPASTTGAGVTTGGGPTGGTVGSSTQSSSGTTSSGTTTTTSSTSSGGGTTGGATTGGDNGTSSAGTTGGEGCGQGALAGPYGAAQPTAMFILPGPTIIVADSLQSACHYTTDVAGSNAVNPTGVALVLAPSASTPGLYLVGADGGRPATATLYRWGAGTGATEDALAGTLTVTQSVAQVVTGNFMLGFAMGVEEVGNFQAQPNCLCP